MLTYLSSYLAMASAIYYVVFEGVMSVIDPKFHDYFIPHSFDVSGQLLSTQGYITVTVTAQNRRPVQTVTARCAPILRNMSHDSCDISSTQLSIIAVTSVS